MTISILCSNYTEPNLMTLDIRVCKLMNYMFKYAKYTVYLSLLEQYNTTLSWDANNRQKYRTHSPAAIRQNKLLTTSSLPGFKAQIQLSCCYNTKNTWKKLLLFNAIMSLRSTFIAHSFYFYLIYKSWTHHYCWDLFHTIRDMISNSWLFFTIISCEPILIA